MSAASVRKACLSFPSKTAIGLDQHAFKDIALLPDNALGSLGEIVKQCFVKFAIVQAFGYVVPGSVCEELIDDLSHFVTNKGRMQLFHDAAKIGKAVKVGTAELGLTLSCKSTVLANDTSLGKLIVSHLGTDGVPMPHVSGNAYGKAGEGPRESIVYAR